jgi:Dolichyl-phosphate-mannose-protein mannosyltransferase
VLACVCVALIAFSVYPNFVPYTGNHSFQYLSVAENTRTGHFGYTSLIHRDAERSFGVAPAPMVTFPLGYPLAIVLVSLFGLSVQGAAFVVSALSILACLPLLAWTGNRLGWSRMLRNATLAIFVFNAAVIDYGTAVASEALFTCFVLLGVSLCVAARLDVDGGRWRWAAAGLAFGAAYFVRYAGLFLVLGFALVATWHLVSSNRALAKGYAIAFFVASMIVLTGVARNIVLVGDWAGHPTGTPYGRGGNEKIVSHALLPLLVNTGASVKDLFVGTGFGLFAGRASGTPWRVSIAGTLFLLSLVAIGIGWLMWYRQVRQQRANQDDFIFKSVGIDVLLLVGVYVACVFYAGLTSVISYGTRMFVPLVPLLILQIGFAVHSILATSSRPNISRTVALRALGTSLCFYVILNFFVVIRQPPPPDPSSITGVKSSPSVNGIPVQSIVQSLTGPTGVIVANNGQAVGHVLGRPTVSLVGPHYSAIEWNEKAVQKVVHQFNANAIVIYVPTATQSNDADFVPSPFVRQLAQGNAPSWMKLVYQSKELLIYAPRFPSL